MCKRVTCGTCAKPTYAGCGAHIEQVLGDVPKAERCSCLEEQNAAAAARKAQSAPPARPAGAKSKWWPF